MYDPMKELLKQFEGQESLEDIAEENDASINPLDQFSTTQLKAEIRRRKGNRKRHIKDSTELSGGHLW